MCACKKVINEELAYSLCICSFLVMGDLTKLSTSKREIRILQESAVKFRDIGALLLRDDTGARVSGIANSFGNHVEAVRMIYVEWMQEDEDHSWKKLIKCFRDVQLNSLARDLELHFRIPSPSDRGKVGDTLQTIAMTTSYECT